MLNILYNFSDFDRRFSLHSLDQQTRNIFVSVFFITAIIAVVTSHSRLSLMSNCFRSMQPYFAVILLLLNFFLNNSVGLLPFAYTTTSSIMVMVTSIFGAFNSSGLYYDLFIFLQVEGKAFNIGTESALASIFLISTVTKSSLSTSFQKAALNTGSFPQDPIDTQEDKIPGPIDFSTSSMFDLVGQTLFVVCCSMIAIYGSIVLAFLVYVFFITGHSIYYFVLADNLRFTLFRKKMFEALKNKDQFVGMRGLLTRQLLFTFGRSVVVLHYCFYTSWGYFFWSIAVIIEVYSFGIWSIYGFLPFSPTILGVVAFISTLGFGSIATCYSIFAREKISPFVYNYIPKNYVLLLIHNPWRTAISFIGQKASKPILYGTLFTAGTFVGQKWADLDAHQKNVDGLKSMHETDWKNAVQIIENAQKPGGSYPPGFELPSATNKKMPEWYGAAAKQRQIFRDGDNGSWEVNTTKKGGGK